MLELGRESYIKIKIVPKSYAADLPKKIVAIPGSLRQGSSNHNILRFLGEMVPENIEYVIYDGVGQLPHFDPGLDNNAPPAVLFFKQLLTEADAVIICTPEYAYGVPGSLKNALDWTVGSSSLDGKTMALITASTGGENAHAALLLILGALNANLPKESTLLIPFVRTKVNSEGVITDKTTAESLTAVFTDLLDAISN